MLKKGLDGENLWNRALHALRQGQADTLKQAAAVERSLIDDISGRLGEGETSLRYTNPARPSSVRFSADIMIIAPFCEEVTKGVFVALLYIFAQRQMRGAWDGLFYRGLGGQLASALQRTWWI